MREQRGWVDKKQQAVAETTNTVSDLRCSSQFHDPSAILIVIGDVFRGIPKRRPACVLHAHMDEMRPRGP